MSATMPIPANPGHVDVLTGRECGLSTVRGEETALARRKERRMENIKACPFCGRIARVVEVIDIDAPSEARIFRVECHSCHSSGPGFIAPSEREARPYVVFTWNRKA